MEDIKSETFPLNLEEIIYTCALNTQINCGDCQSDTFK